MKVVPKTPCSLPAEIFRDVIQCVPCLWDKHSLCSTSKGLHTILTPLLYRSIEVKGIKRCFKLVQTLLKHPELCYHIHALVLRPTYLTMTKGNKAKKEKQLAQALELVVPNLSQLRTFVWSGVEIPNDCLWLALRYSCPLLVDIGTNLGMEEIEPESQLFSFSNLRSFWLTTENRNLHYRPVGNFFIGERLPHALWAMLIDRSPDLQSLTIGHGGSTHHSVRTLDPSPLLDAKWHQLRSLTLVNTEMYDADDSLDTWGQMKSFDRFTAFMEAHRTLEHIHLDRTLYEFDYSKHDLKSTDLHPNDRLHSRGGERRTEIAIMQRAFGAQLLPHIRAHVNQLHHLTRLSLWLDFSKDHWDDILESNNLQSRLPIPQLRNLLKSCPRLEDLILRLSTKKKESFTFKMFSDVLRVPDLKLKRLELWKRSTKKDSHPMLAAARWAKEFQSLEEVVIYHLDSLPWALKLDRVGIKLAGTYSIVRAIDGTPQRLAVVERVWPDRMTHTLRYVTSLKR